MSTHVKNAIDFINVFLGLRDYGAQHGCLPPVSDDLRAELVRCAEIVRASMAAFSDSQRALPNVLAMSEKLKTVDSICAA